MLVVEGLLVLGLFERKIVEGQGAKVAGPVQSAQAMGWTAGSRCMALQVPWGEVQLQGGEGPVAEAVLLEVPS
jgi:hypothetical protein